MTRAGFDMMSFTLVESVVSARRHARGLVINETLPTTMPALLLCCSGTRDWYAAVKCSAMLCFTHKKTIQDRFGGIVYWQRGYARTTSILEPRRTSSGARTKTSRPKASVCLLCLCWILRETDERCTRRRLPGMYV